MSLPLLERELTHSVIGAFYEVYRALGFGFLEHLYVLALERELRARGHQVALEVWVPVLYKEEYLGNQRLDMVVDRKLIVEVKAGPSMPSVAPRIVLSYLRATRLELALLLHFGPRPTFRRFINRNAPREPPK